MTSAFLIKSVIIILATSINPILLFYIMLLLNINWYKYWRNLAYLVILGSIIGYKFPLLSRIFIKYNNH